MEKERTGKRERERDHRINRESSESDEKQHESYVLFAKSDGQPLPSHKLHIIHMDWLAPGLPTLMLLLLCLTAFPLVILYVSEQASAMAA